MGKLSSRDRQLAHQAGQNVSNVENRNFTLASVSAAQTLLRPPLPVVPTTGILTVADTVYFCYLGYTQKEVVVDYIRFAMTVAGAGDQVAEVGIASTDSAPDGAAKTLTILAATGTLGDLTGSAGLYTNSSAAGWKVSPATHLWACARFDMASTQPTLLGVNLDLSAGFVLTDASETSALAAGQTKTGSLIAYGVAATAIAPLLMAQVKP